jgi:hypothetical protein
MVPRFRPHDDSPSAAKLVDLFSDEARDAVQRALDDAAAQRGRMRPVDVVIGKTPEKSEQPGMPDLGTRSQLSCLFPPLAMAPTPRRWFS